MFSIEYKKIQFFSSSASLCKGIKLFQIIPIILIFFAILLNNECI